MIQLANFLVDQVVINTKTVISSLLNKNGPDPGDYAILNNLLSRLNSESMTQEELIEIRSLFDKNFLSNTMQGFGIRKPFGYSGDFKIIDMIYSEHTSERMEYVKWDQFFHQQAAPVAVRNRKAYYKNLMKAKLAEKPITLLNVASGPARDLLEVYSQLKDPGVLQAHCVELDKHAITHATNLCKQYLGQIHFHNKNILRFDTDQKFDVIWSAGLFDYFEDRLFVMALKKFRRFLKDDGEIIIGNFSPENQSRAYMEIFGDWYLIHRSPEQLIHLALDAGFEREKISIGKENLGVNLFMHIKL